MTSAQQYLLGDWTFLPRESQLIRGGIAHHLRPQEVAVLQQLVDAGGSVVARTELLDAVWTGVSVEEAGLTRCISSLRAALGDDARQPRYIETVPKVGYRLVVPASRLDGIETPQSGAGPLTASKRKKRDVAQPLTAVALVLGLLFIGALTWTSRNQQSSPLSERPRFATRLAQDQHRTALNALRRLDHRRALAAAKAVHHEDPPSVDGLLVLAEAHAAMGRTELAAEWAGKAPRPRVSETSSTLELARSAARARLTGQLAEAELLYRRITAIDTTSIAAHHQLARTLHERGFAKAAYEILETKPPEPDDFASALLHIDVLLVLQQDELAAAALSDLQARTRDATPSARAHAILRRASVHARLGESVEAKALASEAERLFEEAQDQLGLLEVALLRSRQAETDGDAATATEAARLALDGFEKFGNTVGAARAHLRLANASRTHVETSWESFTHALDLFEQAGALRGQARALNGWAVALAGNRGEFERARSVFIRAKDLYLSIEDRAQAAAAASNAARCDLFKGRLHSAAAAYREAAALEQELGLERNLALSRFNLGTIERLRARPESATTLLHLAAETFAALGDRNLYAAALIEQSAAQLASGLASTALKTAEAAHDEAQRLGEPRRIVRSGTALLSALRTQSRFEEALQFGFELERWARSNGVYAELAAAELAQTLIVAGRRDQAVGMLPGLRAAFKEPFDLDRHRTVAYALTEAEVGDKARGLELLERIHEAAERQGRVETQLSVEVALLRLDPSRRSSPASFVAEVRSLRKLAKARGLAALLMELDRFAPEASAS